MITVSQSAINSVLRDLESGNPDYVEQFFAVRPDWLEQDGKQATEQEDKSEEKQEEAKA